jgi:hypothetical protein
LISFCIVVIEVVAVDVDVGFDFDIDFTVDAIDVVEGGEVEIDS